MNYREALVRVVNLKKHFPVRKGVLFRKELGQVHAVNGITFDVPKGASFGLVGESGCGKTTVAKLLLRIEGQTSGEVYYGRQGDLPSVIRGGAGVPPSDLDCIPGPLFLPKSPYAALGDHN